MPLTAITAALVSSILASVSNVPEDSLPVIDTATTAISVDQKGALVGIMFPPSNGFVQIGNVVFQLSAAAQIRDQRNFIVMPAYVQAATLVRFQIDQAGRVTRIWMLPPP